ncbi:MULTISPECIES: urease accessory protein UreE [Giesbergeria]|uniref:Urease accessory protein UreE n=1 Tax=Giesbergeria sinuosa TaxID=80883 RepID=A0ABV9QAS3_9BURK
MLQASKRIPQGQGLASVLIRRAATVTLDWDLRQKSRFDCTDSQDRHVGVFLPRGTLLRGGDVLLTVEGDLLLVVAAPQSVLRITHCPEHGSPFDLLRAAYHLGNRHVPIELQPDHLKIEPDHVLADMLCQMHLTVAEAYEAFEPEAGAYGEHATMGHSHHSGSHAHHHPHVTAEHHHDPVH